MNCLTYIGRKVDEKAQFKKQLNITNIASPVWSAVIVTIIIPSIIPSVIVISSSWAATRSSERELHLVKYKTLFAVFFSRHTVSQVYTILTRLYYYLASSQLKWLWALLLSCQCRWEQNYLNNCFLKCLNFKTATFLLGLKSLNRLISQAHDKFHSVTTLHSLLTLRKFLLEKLSH